MPVTSQPINEVRRLHFMCGCKNKACWQGLTMHTNKTERACTLHWFIQDTGAYHVGVLLLITTNHILNYGVLGRGEGHLCPGH